MKYTLIILIIIFLLGIIGAFIFFLAQGGVSGGGGSYSSDGMILYSEDKGDSWKFIENFKGGEVAKFVIGKKEPNFLYAGTVGKGFWIGDMKDKIWSQASMVERGNMRVYDIDEDPFDDYQSLYLAVFQGGRGRLLRYNPTEGSFEELYFTPLERYGVFGVSINRLNAKIIWLVSSDGGFYESRDRGRTWRIIKRFDEGLLGLTDDKSRPGHLWVTTSRGRILETFDAGRSWFDRSVGSDAIRGPDDIKQLFFDDKTGVLYLASVQGLFRSVNGGAGWEDLAVLVPSEDLPVSAIAVDPKDYRRIYAASGRQIYISEDGGFSWRGSDLRINRDTSWIAINPGDTNIVYLGLSK